MDLIQDVLLAATHKFETSRDYTLRGKIQRRIKTKANLFLTLTDPTGTMQVAMAAERALSEQRPAIGQTWEFSGTVDTGRFHTREDRPIPTLVVRVARRLDTPGAPRPAGEFESTFVRGLVLARLRYAAARAFRDLQCIEIEPRLITLSSPISGLEPLQVSYVGFGAPAHLFPSPASQLKQLLIDTDLEGVFAISRVFTTTFRDEVTSYEALTAMALRVRDRSELAPRKGTCGALEAAMTSVLNDEWFGTASAGRLTPVDWKAIPERVSEEAMPDGQSVDCVTLERCARLPDATLDGDVLSEPLAPFLRVIAPPRSIIAERAVLPWFGSSSLEVTTIHLERLASFVSDVDLRELLNII